MNLGSLDRVQYSSITVSDKAKSDNVNQALIDDLNNAVKTIEQKTGKPFKIRIGTASTGHPDKTKTGNPSRHEANNAVDIDMINDRSVTNSSDGDTLHSQLVDMGYKSGVENIGIDKSVLWKIPDHYDHLHVSNQSGSSTPLAKKEEPSKTNIKPDGLTTAAVSSTSSDTEKIKQIGTAFVKSIIGGGV